MNLDSQQWKHGVLTTGLPENSHQCFIAFGEYVFYLLVAKTKSCYWHENTYIDQWNRTDCPERNPPTDGQLTYNKGGMNTKWNTYNHFNKWCLENWTTTCKRMKLEHFLTPYTKINSKGTKETQCRTGNHKTPRIKHTQNILWHKS